MSNLLRVSEVATMLGCSLKHVRRLINAGQIIIIRLSDDPRADRVEQNEVDRFIACRRTNRSLTGEPCQSTNVAIFTGSSFNSTESKLDALLGLKVRDKRKHLKGSSASKSRPMRAQKS